jgi:hypothetical protein
MSTAILRTTILRSPERWVGGVLIALCISQWTLGWAPQALGELQRDASYRVVTGLMLGLLVGAQWVLAYLRSSKRYVQATSHLPTHRWMGALLPALVFVHSERVGHAYLAMLSVIVLLLVTTGVAHPQHLPFRSKLWTRAWMPLHIVLSAAVVALIVVHVVVVTLYH